MASMASLKRMNNDTSDPGFIFSPQDESCADGAEGLFSLKVIDQNLLWEVDGTEIAAASLGSCFSQAYYRTENGTLHYFGTDLGITADELKKK